jgi:hypothetical protein
MLYSEIIAVCSEIHTKYTNTVGGQNVVFMNAKYSGGTYSDHWDLWVWIGFYHCLHVAVGWIAILTYLGSAGFGCRPRDRLYWVRFACFTSVPPGRFQHNGLSLWVLHSEPYEVRCLLSNPSFDAMQLEPLISSLYNSWISTITKLWDVVPVDKHAYESWRMICFD